MKHEPAPKAAPLPALTGARFFAAFAVVVYHYAGGTLRMIGETVADMAKSGPMAVSFFYVLSGAVMTWGCTGPDGGPARPTRTFWAQRAARILPAYFFALVLSLLPFAALVMKLHPGPGGVARIALGVAACSFLVQAFIIPLSVGLNTPGWSISCEAFFYANWPRLVVALRSKRSSFPWAPALALGALSVSIPALSLLALRTVAVPEGPFATLLADQSGRELVVRTVAYFPLLRLPEFALGIVVGHALRGTPARARSMRTDTLRELSLVVALIAVAWLLGSGLPEKVSRVPMASRVFTESGSTALLFALFVWQLARGDGLLKRALSHPAILLLGESSYAVYVLQEPIIVWTTAVLKRVRPAAMQHEVAVFGAYALLLVAISVAVHKRLEMPLRALLLRRFLRKHPEEAGGTQPS